MQIRQKQGTLWQSTLSHNVSDEMCERHQAQAHNHQPGKGRPDNCPVRGAA